MPDDDGDDDSEDSKRDGAARRWLGADGVLDAELPEPLQSALGEFLETGSIDTLRDWVTALHEHLGQDEIGIEHLCVADEATGHRADLDGERYHFACFFDAIILASLVDGAVDIRTTSPDGTVIPIRAGAPGGLTSDPGSTVVSFGIDPAIGRSVGEPTLEQGYAAICPYVNAFSDHDTYSRWAETVPGPTVAMPLSASTALANALVP